MEIKDWKAYFAGKVASAAIFVPSLFYTIADSLYFLDDLIRENKPQGLNIIRDLFLLTLSTASYIACNDLYHKALDASKPNENKIPINSELETVTEEADGVEIEDASHYFKLGKDANNTVDYVSAEKYLRKAAELEPENAKYWSALTATQCNLRDYKSAILSISKAIDLDDQNAKYHELAGKIYQKLGNKEKSRMEFDYAEQLGA